MSREDALSYLALGDSYTIGEGVTGGETWPSQLVMLLRERNVSIAFPRVIATTGWTCDELSAAMDHAKPPLDSEYDLVSLLIGVNDQYRFYDRDSYAGRFGRLLDRAIALAGGRPGRVFVLSIPDWGVTPYAADLQPPRDPAVIAAELDFYNATAERICAEKSVAFVDNSAISRELGHEHVVADGLHPDAHVYKAWAENALPVVTRLLGA